YETIIERYNSDLANTFGNLVNRTIAMQNKYFDGVICEPADSEAVDEELKQFALDTVKKVEKCFETYRVADAIEAVLNLAKRSNKYIDETMPWALAKDESKKARLGTVLYNLLEAIRYIAVLLSPFMPETSEKIFAQMNCDVKNYDSLENFGGTKAGVQVGNAEALFARIDSEKMLADIAAKQETSAKAENEPVQLPEINFDDFTKVELRVAKIVECEPIKKAKKLLKIQVNDGTSELRQIVSGIAPWYKPEDLIGKSVVIVANLKPAKLCGEMSNGMLLAGDTADGDVKVMFVDGIEPGTQLR
ncbi:MAG: methionine--tRNA ligase subunit beta, partial [Eubacterium sp.]|nr:methionine--tRNA ligase subunit beta [Eubacterium sp.]